MYAMALHKVFQIMVVVIAAWSFITYWFHIGTEKLSIKKKGWMILNGILLLAALYGILSYTVIGRNPRYDHVFVFTAAYSGEFWREMVMNVFLYFPLGICLPNVVSGYKRAVFLAFFLSFGIEMWQLAAGTGLSQGTDIVCNTLGVAIGGIPHVIMSHMVLKQQKG